MYREIDGMPKTVIRTPFPSPAHVAEILGLSRSDVERLDRMMDSILIGNGHGPSGIRGRGRPEAQASKKKASLKERT